MKFEEPKVEFIQFDNEVVTASSTTKCVDHWLGGVLTCEGSNMAELCGAMMKKTA